MPTRASEVGRSDERTTIVTLASSSAKMRANSIAMMPPPTMTTERGKKERPLIESESKQRVSAPCAASSTGVVYRSPSASRRTAFEPVASSAFVARSVVRRVSALPLPEPVNSTSTAILPSSDGASRPKPRKCGIRASESARALPSPDLRRIESTSSRTCAQMAASPMPILRSTGTSMRSEASRSALEKSPVGPVNWNCDCGVASTKIADLPKEVARSAPVMPTGPPPRTTRS